MTVIVMDGHECITFIFGYISLVLECRANKWMLFFKILLSGQCTVYGISC